MKVNFNRVFLCYLLLAIASVQFVYAQHSTIHIEYYLTQHDSDDKEDFGDICQSCVTGKILTHNYLPQTNFSFSIPSANYQSFNLQLFTKLQSFNKPFRSQAPPILFS